LADKYEIRPLCVADLEAFPQVVRHGLPVIVPGPAYTGLYRGTVIACAGIVPKHRGVGEAWLVMVDGAERGHGYWIARNVRRLFDELMEKERYRRVQITIDDRRPDLMRWMRFLGFTFEDDGVLRAYGEQGQDCLMCARVRNGR
jgi:hypothetical protein